MTYQTVFEYTNATNNTGLSGIFGYVANISSMFAPMLLLSLFVIIFLGSSYSQMRTRGSKDTLGSFAVASIVTAVIAILMYMVQPPIISGQVVVITLVLAVIGVAGLFTSNER